MKKRRKQKNILRLALIAAAVILCLPKAGRAACDHYQDTVFTEDLLWQNAVPAGVGIPGYTGDGVCPYCGEVCEPGREIPAFSEPDPTEAPATPVPETAPPATDSPATDPPVTAPPATEAPVVTAPPATAPPAATAPPETAPPATEAPVITAPPVTVPPATEVPVITAPPATVPPATEIPAVTTPRAESKTPASEEDAVIPAVSRTENAAPAAELPVITAAPVGDGAQRTLDPDVSTALSGTEASGGNTESLTGSGPGGGSGSSPAEGEAWKPFSKDFPYRRVRMRPEKGIQIRRAGITIWPVGEGDSAGSPLLKLLGR